MNRPCFKALVRYRQPTYAELRSRFGFVDQDYAWAFFVPIECCRGVGTEEKEIAFEYFRIHYKAYDDNVIAEMDRQGLRPAMYEELLAFAQAYPCEKLEYSIVAFGSVNVVRGKVRGAYLFEYNGIRYLNMTWFDCAWGEADVFRFLVVRK